MPEVAAGQPEVGQPAFCGTVLYLCIACAKNQVGGAEDSLRGAFTDALALIPVLDVSTAEIRSRHAERFTAKQRHGTSAMRAATVRAIPSALRRLQRITALTGPSQPLFANHIL